MHEQIDLTGKILIAMPAMSDPRFARSVVLVCEHSGQGAMGIVLNHPLPEISFPQLLSQLGIDADGPAPVTVRFGGPVEPSRGFVLHAQAQGARPHEGRIEVAPGLALTGTRDILEALARGGGPAPAVLALGYCGWHGGQLEAEILDNGWLVGEASNSLIFGAEDARKWAEALHGQGIDPSMLSGMAGRA